jgi:hypothetical protein
MLDINVVLVAIAFLLIIVYWISVFIIFYHLVRFGVGRQPKILSALFVLGSFILFFISIVLFSNINTGQLNIQLQNIINSNPSFFNINLI